MTRRFSDRELLADVLRIYNNTVSRNQHIGHIQGSGRYPGRAAESFTTRQILGWYIIKVTDKRDGALETRYADPVLI